MLQHETWPFLKPAEKTHSGGKEQNHTVHSALPLSMQLKRSSVMFCELSDGRMTSPCSSLTPIRRSLLVRFSLHPQNCSCQIILYSRHWASHQAAQGSVSEKPLHSFFLLFYCPCISLAHSLLLPPLFTFFLSASLSLPLTDLLPQELATSNCCCCCCRALPGWPKPECFGIGRRKVTWAAAVARPRTGETESVPASSSSSDSKGWCFSVRLWVSECVRDQGSVLKLSESRRHKSQSCQHTLFSARRRSIIGALSDRNAQTQWISGKYAHS